jgi:hypothetical protein
MMFDDINNFLLDSPLAAIRGYLEAKLNTQSELLQQAFLIYVDNLTAEEQQEPFDLSAEAIQNVDSCYDAKEHSALIRGLLHSLDPQYVDVLNETIESHLIPRESVVRLLSHRLVQWYGVPARAETTPIAPPIVPQQRPENSPSPLSLNTAVQEEQQPTQPIIGQTTFTISSLIIIPTLSRSQTDAEVEQTQVSMEVANIDSERVSQDCSDIDFIVNESGEDIKDNDPLDIV